MQVLLFLTCVYITLPDSVFDLSSDSRCPCLLSAAMLWKLWPTKQRSQNGAEQARSITTPFPQKLSLCIHRTLLKLSDSHPISAGPSWLKMKIQTLEIWGPFTAVLRIIVGYSCAFGHADGHFKGECGAMD